MLEKNHSGVKKRVKKSGHEHKHGHGGGGHHHHPSHDVHLPRLRRVKGQIEGIEGMIQAGRYCPDIIAQLRAASAALKAIEAEVFKSHLQGCVKSAILSKDAFEAGKKIEEVMKLVF